MQTTDQTEITILNSALRMLRTENELLRAERDKMRERAASAETCERKSREALSDYICPACGQPNPC